MMTAQIGLIWLAGLQGAQVSPASAGWSGIQ
jgi:hypothetical protein